MEAVKVQAPAPALPAGSKISAVFCQPVVLVPASRSQDPAVRHEGRRKIGAVGDVEVPGIGPGAGGRGSCRCEELTTLHIGVRKGPIHAPHGQDLAAEQAVGGETGMTGMLGAGKGPGPRSRVKNLATVRIATPPITRTRPSSRSVAL